MGGDLTVTSTPGKGSEFRLDVVMPRARPPRAQQRDTKRLGANEQGLRLLCAEDNPFGRVILDTILGELGHAADFVGNGEAATEAAARGGYDAVLMDVTLPVLDGIDATRRIRALPPPAGQVPIIGISGVTESAAGSNARAAGMDGFLQKPVSPKVLAEELARVTTTTAAGQPRG
jgi:CheY-like chemotaxis protein